MKIAASVILVVASAEYGCSIDNVDRSSIEIINMPTIEACEDAAKSLDAVTSQRAVCTEVAQ